LSLLLLASTAQITYGEFFGNTVGNSIDNPISIQAYDQSFTSVQFTKWAINLALVTFIVPANFLVLRGRKKAKGTGSDGVV